MLLRATVISFLALAGIAVAGQALSLGAGTACTLASQREARKTLGVRGKHVLACASPAGTLARVYITRAGRVACVEQLQVARDGRMTPIGASCRGVATGETASKAQDIGEPINLSGNWSVEAAVATCTLSVVQDGGDLALDGTCPVVGTLSGRGTISFTGQTFRTEGSASGGIVEMFCPGEMVRMDGTVSPDGQTVDGNVTCGIYALSFRSRRID